MASSNQQICHGEQKWPPMGVWTNYGGEESRLDGGEESRLDVSSSKRKERMKQRLGEESLFGGDEESNKSSNLSFSIDNILGKKNKTDMQLEANYIEPENTYQRSTCFESSCTKCGKYDHGLSYMRSSTIQCYPRFDWLNCTRYKPPKITRAKRKQNMSERASRQPRIPFTPFQQTTLEKQFQTNQYLTSGLLTTLAHALKLSKQRIKVWYQNRRARDRREEQSKCLE